MEHSILPSSGVENKDQIAEKLTLAAQYVLIAVFGLLPILFFPSITAPFGYSKTLIVVVGLFVALILFGFSILRSGSIKGSISIPVIFLWSIVLIASVSGLLSDNITDSFFGDVLSTHTVIFMFLLALTTTVWAFFGSHKFSVMRLFVLLSVSTLVLALFHILRVIFGPDVLTFGIFTSATNSLIGGWNDLAIFFGLIVIISISALQQLPLTRWLKALFIGVIALSLFMLAIINFIAVWVVLGVASLIVVMYGLAQGKRTSQESLSEQRVGASFPALIMSIIVLLFSILFVLTGSFLGNSISDAVGISYVEVRPSLSATTEIIRQVYQDDMLLGVGPNHFVDAWRTFKNPAINSTVFWATDFEAGIGYIPTMFASLGILGGIFWVLFFGSFLVTGVRTLLASDKSDRIWYFIGSSSFIGGLFVWGMSFVYVPGPVLLFFAAVCTGLVVAAHGAVGKRQVYTYNVSGTGKGNIALISVVTLIIIGSISALYFLGNHYAGVYTFNKSQQQVLAGASIDVVERTTVGAFNLFEDDRYARRVAEYQLARISSLLQVQNPAEDERDLFLSAVANGREAGNRAVSLDSTDANNWGVLGAIYLALVPGNVEGAYEESRAALERARELDPHNPARVLALARLELANNNREGARDLAQVAVRMKPDYRDGVYFLSQTQILLGDLDRAAESARGMTVLDPRNPVFHFQLGVIETSRENTNAAINALERAVALDQDYSNARYFLAINYDQLNRKEDARAQLEHVLELNPGNALVIELLAQLSRGEGIRVPTSNALDGAQSQGNDLPVEESEETVSEETVSEEDLDSPLISPVNNVSSNSDVAPDQESSETSTESSLPPAGTENEETSE